MLVNIEFMALAPRHIELVAAAELPQAGVFGRDLPMEHRRHLGRSYDQLYWDASHGIYPNALAALLPTVRAGGRCLLHLPETSTDPEHQRLGDYGSDFRRWRPRFNGRLRRFINASPTGPSAEIINDWPALDFRAPRQIILGPRGAGKSSLLARHHRENGGLLVLPFAGNEIFHGLRFLPPDEVLRRKPPAAHLHIDECAAIDQEQLLALTAHYRNYTLASSVEGYEGSGRRFFLKTLPLLRARDGCTVHQLSGSHRFASDDPLDYFYANVFLTRPPAPVLWPTGAALQLREISWEELNDEALLRQIYGLAHGGHYRTSPEDLKRLLDCPDQRLWSLWQGADMVAFLQILEEEPLPEPLARAVMNNERRPRGRLLLQQLLLRSQSLDFNRPLARISRIVVAENFRRRGLARQLVEAAQKNSLRPVGVCHRRDEQLNGFWRALGFQSLGAGPTSLWLSRQCARR